MGAEETSKNAPFLPTAKLREIVKQTLSSEKLETSAENLIQNSIDEFVEDLLANACKLAQHRNSQTLEASDLLFYLERQHDISIPGFEVLEDKTAKKASSSTQTASAVGTAATLDEHARRVASLQRGISSTIASSAIPGSVPQPIGAHPNSGAFQNSTPGTGSHFPRRS